MVGSPEMDVNIMCKWGQCAVAEMGALRKVRIICIEFVFDKLQVLAL